MKMNISSKSILSPGRPREPPQISLSTSLSRRLRNSGSLKGGLASPMFPSVVGKKKGCAFENPEPSSPKVTCIGQVRVKTKKQGKKLRINRSRRNSSRGSETSFRKTEQQLNTNDPVQIQHHNSFQALQNSQQHQCLPHRNQRWVHLPLTICEALKGLGSELNCFLLCRSSCMSSERDQKQEIKTERSDSNGGRSCGAVFARWLVSLQDGDGKQREIELVVEEEREGEQSSRSQRRQMFEGIEFSREESFANTKEEEDEGTRVTISIPPKNALLLMRCRSDPVKMAALANRFWDPPAPEVDDEEEDQEVVKLVVQGDNAESKVEPEVMELEKGVCYYGEQEAEEQDKNVNFGVQEVDINAANNVETNPKDNAVVEEKDLVMHEEEQDDAIEKEGGKLDINHPAFEEILYRKNLQAEENITEQEQGVENRDGDVKRDIFSTSVLLSGQSEQVTEESKREEEVKDEDAAEVAKVSTEVIETGERSCEEEDEEEKAILEQPPKSDNPDNEVGPGHSKEQESQTEKRPENKEAASGLPDCLLMMMCEPKLSMEVSKETWVCSSDFIRRPQPEKEKKKQVRKSDVRDEPKKQGVTLQPNPVRSTQPIVLQPARSSCSYPAKSAAHVTRIEQKQLVNSKECEPLALTRCKSEPKRSAAKLSPGPDACFWKNRELEPQRPATLGVGF